MDWIRKAPTAVVIAVVIVCGVVAAGVLTAYVVLALNGADTTEFRQWINTVGQILVFPLLGVGAVASVSAARSASRTEEQTNGTALRRDEQIADLTAEVRRHDQERP